MVTAKPAKFLIKNDQRVFTVGKTGSGKTTLMKALLWKLPNIIILDPKRTFRLPSEWEHSTYTDFSKVRRHEGPETVIYRPDEGMLDELAEPFFKFVFERGNTIVYIDEVLSVTKPNVAPRGYLKCLQLGRELGISTWSATQRPSRIPLPIMTEADHFFMFRLNDPDDRTRMARYTDHKVLSRNPTGNGFWYYRDGDDNAKYYDSANVGKVLSK